VNGRVSTAAAAVVVVLLDFVSVEMSFEGVDEVLIDSALADEVDWGDEDDAHRRAASWMISLARCCCCCWERP